MARAHQTEFVFAPILPPWFVNLVAFALGAAAVASVVITYVGALPWLAAFRERAALALLFESVIPLLFFWAWFTIFVRDRPRPDRPSDDQSSAIWG